VNGEQTRKCVDKNDCGTFYKRPEESRECVISQQQTIEAAQSRLIKEIPKVESYLTFEQLIAKYLPILLITFVSIAASLIVFGIRKDQKRR
jgi:hypothetical protein